MPPKPLRFSWLFAIVSGITLVFAYPPWNVELAVWLWMLPLLFVLWPLPGFSPPRRPFWFGFLAGIAFFIPNLFWIRHSSRVIAGAFDHRWIGFGPELLGFGAVIGLAGCCAFCFGAWAWFMVRVARPDFTRLANATWQESTWLSLRSAALSGFAWIGLEWLRSMYLFSGFGWNGLGVGLHQNTVLTQVADLVGVMGLSFLPVFVACSGYNTVMRLVMVFRGQGTCRSRLDFTLALTVLLTGVGYGIHKIRASDGETVKVRTVLVQTNIPQAVIWSGEAIGYTYELLDELTRVHATARDGQTNVDLVVWPEAALPMGLLDQHPQMPPHFHADYFNNLLKAGDYSLVTGTTVREPLPHNSVTLMRGEVDAGFTNAQHYHKVNLVAFGEYLPLRNIPPFSWLKGVLPGDFVHGQSTEPLKLEKPAGVQIIPLICFEDTVGRLARKFVRDAPQILVNVTNDGWFLQSEEMEVHLANAKFRAIELRRPMCRATNTGVTCFIDTKGRETSRLTDAETGSIFTEGWLLSEVAVPVQPVTTVYARYGDWFPVCGFGLTMILSTISLVRQRRG